MYFSDIIGTGACLVNPRGPAGVLSSVVFCKSCRWWYVWGGSHFSPEPEKSILCPSVTVVVLLVV